MEENIFLLKLLEMSSFSLHTGMIILLSNESRYKNHFPSKFEDTVCVISIHSCWRDIYHFSFEVICSFILYGYIWDFSSVSWNLEASWRYFHLFILSLNKILLNKWLGYKWYICEHNRLRCLLFFAWTSVSPSIWKIESFKIHGNVLLFICTFTQVNSTYLLSLSFQF